MFKEVISVFHGALIWKIFQMRFQIDEKKVVLVLVNNRKGLDYYALVHLEDFMNRKYAKEAIVVFSDKEVCTRLKELKLNVSIRLSYWKEDKIKKLYRYYSFYKFSDKIVFTYTDNPKENQLGKVLRETSIGEEEAVCLGLYRLRRVPEVKDVFVNKRVSQMLR